MSHIPLTSGKTVDFHVPALGKFVPATDTQAAHVLPDENIVFFLRVPTWEDRDVIALRIYSLGVREVTPQQIQAVIISEMFEVVEDQDRAGRDANWLEEHWAAQTRYQAELANWAEQEAVRRLDAQEAGKRGKKFVASAPPKDPSSARERSKANMLVAEVTDQSRRVREKLADQQLYEKRFAHVMARLQIAGWMGLETQAVFDQRPVIDAPCLTKLTIESLRGELERLDPTGAAWEELIAAAGNMFDLPRSAEKNSLSQHGSSSPPAGSETKNSGLEISVGASTLPAETVLQPPSSSEPTPGGTSPQTTAPSSEPTPG